MNANVDLRQLARPRENEAAPPVSRSRRHFWTRYGLPGVILLGFVGLLAWAARDHFLPTRPVTVVPVLTTTAEGQQEGTPLFQAAGWIEPRPTPILVAALAEGVVDKLLVVEGQEVKPKETIALLVAKDAELAVQAAEADLEHHKADVINSRAVLEAATVNLEKPVHLQAALAEADALLAQKETELATLPFQIRAAEARRHFAKVSFDNKKKIFAEGALPELQFHQAKSEWETAEATVLELQARKDKLAREIEAQKLRRDALRLRLDLKVDEIRQKADAVAKLKIAEVHLRLSEIALETAQLRLARMTVRAPVAGRVLALVARPGTRMMGMVQGSPQDASTVITMYDPNKLQVRADVRLEDVPRVQPKMKVLVETPAAPAGPIQGEVLYATGFADIQKNTLQVKVALIAPPSTVRADMLVRATFLAPPTKSDKKPGERLRLLIPRNLVDSAEGSSRVWLADQAAGVARQRTVKLGLASGDLVEVLDGLNAADRLISGGRDGLRDGQRITVTGEDAGPGSGQAPPSHRLQPADHGKKGNHK